MKKRFLCLMVSIVALLSLVSCNSADSIKSEKATDSSDVAVSKEEYTYDKGTRTLTINIQGEMKYDCENAPWKDIEYPEHIVLSKGITSISNWGFGCMTGEEDDPLNFNCIIKTVEIPNTVKTIGEAAFWNCTNLTKVNIPVSVKTIGKSAFGDCKKLKSVTIPENVKIIEEGLFYGCTSLEKVALNNCVEKIQSYAFGNCRNLKEITIPKSVEKIGKEAFGYKDYRVPMKDFVIKGYKGTVAEKYAEENGFKFIAI
jgi:hypothetical protein